MGSAGTRTDAPSTIHASTIQRIAETFASRFIRGKLYRSADRERLWTANELRGDASRTQPLPGGRFFFVPVFFSTRSFHAVRRAPVITFSFAFSSRLWVLPIRPHPPGIGRKTSGSS